MTNLCIIPARGGSRRIPRKNIKEFRGQPIIAYSIKTARKTGRFNGGIWVSTEDEEIAEVARQYGAEVLERSMGMAQDDVGTQEVIRDALRQPEILRERPDLVLCFYPCAPLAEADDILRGFNMLKKSPMPYAYTTDRKGQDAGQWYLGRAWGFAGLPLLGQSKFIKLPDDRVCDINTPEDWARAEQLYDAIHARG